MSSQLSQTIKIIFLFPVLITALIACGERSGTTQMEPAQETASDGKQVNNAIPKAWWKESTIYQIYPRSFKDSDGDGVGDLRGIISKLDYLKELGVDVVWLSPVYKSPNDDNGYDISDYRDIMDEFGTMADFDELLAGMKSRNIKLIMDLVVNHSSDEHQWFEASRKSKDNPYRNYYTWRAPVDGKEPNNWKSFFGGSAWELDPTTGEYYLHLFTKKQPDLNWENRKLREEVYSLMRFWLDKGVSGFRMDVIPFISKPVGLPDFDYASIPGGLSQAYANGPKLHDYLQEMHREVTSHYDVFTVGEAPGVTPELAKLYVNRDRNELDMIFHFQHLKIDRDKHDVWKKIDYPLSRFKDIFEKWDEAIGRTGWGTAYLSNHDTARIVSHFGDDTRYRNESAKMLATLLFTLRGTVGVYQGDELGMTNVSFNDISDFDDVQAKNAYRERVENGDMTEKDFIKALNTFGRDNARTPLQWDASANAGFTSGKPWLRVNSNYPIINAEQQLRDKNSVFHYYKKMIQLRKQWPIFVYGDSEILDKENNQVYAYLRSYGDDKALVLLNFTGESVKFSVDKKVNLDGANLLVSNYNAAVNGGFAETNTAVLKPYEARVYALAMGSHASNNLAPDWAKNMVMYEVNVRNFSEEGTFKAFEQHLPRLKQLGVNTLWFMPVQPIGEKNIKGSLGSPYAIKNFETINPRMGTMAEFKSLVDKIHSMGMKVLIEWVANHTAWDNVLTESHPEWYTKDSDGNFVPPRPEWDDVIEMDYSQRDLQVYMQDQILHWVKETDIDGFRFDVAGMMPRSFWEELRPKLDAIKPLFIFTDGDQVELTESALHMIYNYDFLPVMEAVAKGKKDVSALHAYLQKENAVYPEGAYKFYFTSGHVPNSFQGSVFERLGPAAEAFLVFNAFMDGIPLIYSGQEAGLNKRLDFFEKDLIEWKQHPFADLYRAMFLLKQRNPAMWNAHHGGPLNLLDVSENNSLFAARRQKNGREVVAFINFSGKKQTVPAKGLLQGQYKNVIAGDTLKYDESIVSLDPWDYLVLEK